jgi:hypothetical protein
MRRAQTGREVSTHTSLGRAIDPLSPRWLDVRLGAELENPKLLNKWSAILLAVATHRSPP